MDGIGDGLSIAQGAKTLEEAREAIRDSLLKARLAKDRHNLAELTELASEAPSRVAPQPIPQPPPGLAPQGAGAQRLSTDRSSPEWPAR